MQNDVMLSDGSAQRMGDGVFALCQHDAEQGAQCVVVTADDLRRLLATEEA